MSNLTTIRLAGYDKSSVVNGTGVRYTIFTQGCPHHCKGCHNEHTWLYNGGFEEKLDKIFAEIESFVVCSSGITISGGEPFTQEIPCYLIAKHAKELGMTVWTYTGYRFEDLWKRPHPLVLMTDVLVDGPIVKKQRCNNVPYIGSANQRIINLSKARETGILQLGE